MSIWESILAWQPGGALVHARARAREEPLHLFAPSLARSPLRLARRREEGGRLLEEYTEAGWVQGRYGWNWSIVGAHRSTPLLRGLPRLLVTNDFMAQPARFTTAGPAGVALPVDEDPYDGKTWKVHADDAAFAAAVLDADMWQLLTEIGERRKLLWWIDDDRLMAPAAQLSREQLQTIGDALDARISSGAMDAWPGGPDPSQKERLDCLPGTDWPISPVAQDLAWWNRELARHDDLDLQVDGQVDGEPFVALRDALGLAASAGLAGRPPLYAPAPPGIWASGLVLVRLAHPVADHVVYAKRSLTSRSTLGTEWLDVDQHFAVRSADERLGHELTTPRLMEFLYDNLVQRLELKGEWIFVRVARFDAENIRRAVRVLVAARALLPTHEL